MNNPPANNSGTDLEMAGAMPSYQAAPQPNRLRRFLVFLRRFWWVPVITLVLAVGAAVAYVMLTPPVYASRAVMWGTGTLRLPEGAYYTEDLQNYFGTQIGLLQSGKMRQLAVGRLPTNTVPVGKDGMVLPVVITASIIPKTTMFKLEATGSDPAFIQTLLNAVMDEFLDYKRTIRKTVSGETLDSITKQVVRLEQELKTQQDNFVEFQRTNNSAILQEQGVFDGGYLAKLRGQLSELKLEYQLLEPALAGPNPVESTKTNVPSPDRLRSPEAAPAPDLKSTTEASSQPDRLRSPEAAPAPDPQRFAEAAASSSGSVEMQNALTQLAVLKGQRAQLVKYQPSNHFKIGKLDAEIEDAENLVETYRQHNRERLVAARQTAKVRMDNIQAIIKEWESKVGDANNRIAETEQIKNRIHRLQSTYERFMTLLQSVDISGNINQESIAILERASPAVRSYDNELKTSAAAILAGLFFGIGIVYLVGARDDRFLSLNELGAQFGEAIVGQVPELPRPRRKERLALVELDDQRHMYAESYRSLRSALLFMATEGTRPKVVLITSAVPNEGKSTVAANLARTLAFGGAKVLLVDADLRKGVLHQLLGLHREPGLAELLLQPDNLDSVIQTYPLPNLSFISSGNAAARVSELFLAREFDQLLDRLREQYDYILIDSSPVFAVDDATTLAPKVDGVLFVVRNSFTRAQPLQEALELLYQRQARILGLIYNRADASSRSYYYYKHADYYRPAKPA